MVYIVDYRGEYVRSRLGDMFEAFDMVDRDAAVMWDIQKLNELMPEPDVVSLSYPFDFSALCGLIEVKINHGTGRNSFVRWSPRAGRWLHVRENGDTTSDFKYLMSLEEAWYALTRIYS